MAESNFSSVPPRAYTNPAQPSPMTNLGTLSDYGVPSDKENITDIPPDFGWMSALEIFMGAFTMNQQDPPEKEIATIYPMSKVPTVLPAGQYSNMQDLKADWHFIPFCSSRWWSGGVRLRFMAIKPPRVTGKILFSWFPDVGATGNTTSTDRLRRSIKYEWDLGTSNEYSLSLTGYNITRLRPTWIPKQRGAPNDHPSARASCVIRPPLVQYSMGRLELTIGQILQPGSLFPDSIRILVFQSFEDTTFHTSVDIRGDATHFFGIQGAPDFES